MKKIISIVLAICIGVTGLPFIALAANITPEISLDEFIAQLQLMQEEYDEHYVSELVFEDGSEFYHVDGEAFVIEDENGEPLTAYVCEEELDIPAKLIEENCSENLNEEMQCYAETEQFDAIEYAEAIGYEVEISEDKAVFTQPYQTHRLIVKSKYNIDPLDSVAVVEGYNDLHIVQFDNIESTIDALEYYENQRNIEYAEPDIIMSTMEYEDVEDSAVGGATIDLPYGNHLSWGSEVIGVDDYIDYLGDVNELPEIVVGIIDTGIDLDHEFLQDRIIETHFNISGSGTENSEDDDQGHGTHVAGIVVDNTTENVKIKGYKILNDKGGGTLLNVCLAIDKATEDRVNVINMSLSGKGKSKELESSVKNAIDNGVVVCVAAGNSGLNASEFIPASIDGCITVAAMNEQSGRPLWTNYGPSVDIIAPGVSIYSSYIGNTYESLSGTSMATPFAAAASALILSKDISLDYDSILTLLEENGKESGIEFKQSPKVCDVYLYIGEMTTYGQERTAQPTVTLQSGRYYDPITVELSCPEEANIYYTLDGSRATQNHGMLYTEPIVIDKITRLHIMAIADGKLKSLQTIADYYITTTDPEGNFEIDTNGIITAYNGTNNYLTIPDTINGITVTGIGSLVFRNSAVNETMVMLKCPDTLTYVGDKALKQMKSLTSFDCKNLKRVGDYAFQYCRKLEHIDLTQLEEAGKYAFHECTSIYELKNEKLTIVNKYTFNALKNVLIISLPNVTKIEYGGIQHEHMAENIYLPKVESLGAWTLSSSYAVTEINLPALKSLDEGGNQISYTYSLLNLNLPNFNSEIPKNFLYGSYIENLKMGSLESIGENALEGLTRLKCLYLPNVKNINSNALVKTKSLEILFLPSAVNVASLPEKETTTIYFSDALKSIINVSDKRFKVVAPADSYADYWAKQNNYEFQDCYSMANALGSSIRLAPDNSANLRFGFTWDELDELNEFASSIEYGFEFGLTPELGLKFIAKNRVFHEEENNTSFNLVFTNIPKTQLDVNIYARAYVNIDGMIFKSDILERSFLSTANKILSSDIDEEIKEEIKNILGEYDEKSV